MLLDLLALLLIAFPTLFLVAFYLGWWKRDEIYLSEAETATEPELNTFFHYLHRDGANHKEVIFRGIPENLSIAESTLRQALCDPQYKPSNEDYCCHEFEGLKVTTQPWTDHNTIDEFIAILQKGWKETNVPPVPATVASATVTDNVPAPQGWDKV